MLNTLNINGLKLDREHQLSEMFNSYTTFSRKKKTVNQYRWNQRWQKGTQFEIMVTNYEWRYNGADQRIVVSNASDEIILSVSVFITWKNTKEIQRYAILMAIVD